MTATRSGPVAGAPAGNAGKKGGPSPFDGEIAQLRKALEGVRIEVVGPPEFLDEILEALYEAVDRVVWGVMKKLKMKINECDEEPDSITSSGIGFRWVRNTYCLGKVGEYHLIAELVEGFNGDEGKVELKSVELIKGDVNER
jgi:hypothetical protein